MKFGLALAAQRPRLTPGKPALPELFQLPTVRVFSYRLPLLSPGEGAFFSLPPVKEYGKMPPNGYDEFFDCKKALPQVDASERNLLTYESLAPGILC